MEIRRGGGHTGRHLDDEWMDELEAADAPDLTCPGCGSDLSGDEAFGAHRVCGQCRRHFPLRARDRLALIADIGSFREVSEAREASAEAVVVTRGVGADRPPGDKLPTDAGRGVLGDAVLAGTARIGGSDVAIVVLDEHLLGLAVSAIVAEKIIVAFELALARSIPLVALCAGGAAQTRSGPLSLVQDARLAASASRLHHAGIPMVAVLTHPTAARLFSAVASQCDVIVAEPGTHVGAEPAPWSRTEAGDSRPTAVETLLTNGAIDAVVDRVKLRGHLASLLDLLCRRGALRVEERATVRRRPVAAWEALLAVRQPDRPDAASYLTDMVEGFVELHGDRIDADDPSLIGGFGRLSGLTVAVIARRRSEVGKPASAARKAMRVARLAAHLELPLVSLVESPIDHEGSGHISPDLSFAVAHLLGLLVVLPVPLVAVAVGEVRDPLAAALMVSDRTLMQDQAVYTAGAGFTAPVPRRSAIGPTSDLDARSALALTAWECARLGLVDVVVPEPEPAAHADAAWAVATVRSDVISALNDLAGIGQRRLLDTRQRRLRALGQSTPEGLAAARSELYDLQEWQRSVRRSWEDLRDRWEHRTFARPHVPFQRPELADLAQRLATRRAEGGWYRRPGGSEGDPDRS